MQLSKYNIISKVKDSDEYFVVNSLSGQAEYFGSKDLRATE